MHHTPPAVCRRLPTGLLKPVDSTSSFPVPIPFHAPVPFPFTPSDGLCCRLSISTDPPTWQPRSTTSAPIVSSRNNFRNRATGTRKPCIAVGIPGAVLGPRCFAIYVYYIETVTVIYIPQACVICFDAGPKYDVIFFKLSRFQ